MTSQAFCYWLMGFIEVTEAEECDRPKAPLSLSSARLACVKKHLSLVFAHELDKAGVPAAQQDTLNHLHHGADVRPRC